MDQDQRDESPTTEAVRAEIVRRLPGLVLMLLEAATAGLARIMESGDATLAECLAALTFCERWAREAPDAASEAEGVEELLAWVRRQPGA